MYQNFRFFPRVFHEFNERSAIPEDTQTIKKYRELLPRTCRHFKTVQRDHECINLIVS